MNSALLPNYGAPELEFSHGEGCYLTATDGRRFLDFTMGIAVNSLGHCHPALVAALTDQAHKLWHTSNLFRIGLSEELAHKLTKLTFADRVFFCNSGSEAVECGFKLMRRFHHFSGNPQRKRIIALSESFHGRTLAPIAASANPLHTEGFLMGDWGFDQAPFGNLEALAAKLGEDAAGIILEPVQGEGGIRAIDLEYLKGIKSLCEQHEILLMFDEVQCGIGRTGTLYAHQQMGVSPDILASAKGLGGGFPIGACLSTERVGAAMTAGSHGSTFGGNPLATRVGNAVIDVITAAGFLDQVVIHGHYFGEGLQRLVDSFPELLAEATGLGLMRGLKCRIEAPQLNAALQQAGMLVVKAGGNSLRLLPPLNVTRSELDEALTILHNVLSQWEK
ncbi:MAG: aspartate aminotransferase family protein [Gammaproteobacteria bacterium]